MGFISSQVPILFSFSNMGVLERNNLKEPSSQKSITSLIILCSKFTIIQDPSLLTISTQVLGIPQRQKTHFPGLNGLTDEKYKQYKQT